jgi:prohibitin 1
MLLEAGAVAHAFCVSLCAVQAAKDVAETMSKSRNVVYIPNSGHMLMQINPNQ